MSLLLQSTLLRRSIVVPLYAALWVTLLALLPALLPLALLVDLLRRRGMVTTRVYAFFIVYFSYELIGLTGAFALWLGRIGPLADQARYEHANHRLQWWWARGLGGAAFGCFSINVRVHVDDEPTREPMLLLMRHASVADTVLAAGYVSAAHRIPLRYVLKRELLLDPCLDVVGLRTPNYFVERDAEDADGERDAVGRLGTDVPAGEGVLIYPEGTRFTKHKRDQLLRRADKKGDAKLRERVEAYSRVLPPRPSGTLALMNAMQKRGADVWLGAHRGLEGSSSFNELWNGGLIGVTVDVAFRRVGSLAGLPVDAEARARWLDELWHQADAFVADPTVLPEPQS